MSNCDKKGIIPELAKRGEMRVNYFILYIYSSRLEG